MKVADNDENFQKCICPSCPTYNDCMKERTQGLFCARVESDCDFEKTGCLCPSCPVAGEYSISGTFYCDTGATE
ncbi:MAG: DUF2769 domain-containing protein [Candidatus Lokiarchaeia archaeon]